MIGNTPVKFYLGYSQNWLVSYEEKIFVVQFLYNVTLPGKRLFSYTPSKHKLVVYSIKEKQYNYTFYLINKI